MGKERKGTAGDPCICISALKVELEFPDADISSYNETTFLEALSAALGVPLENLAVTRVRAGSIIVTFAVFPPPGQKAMESLTLIQKQETPTISHRGAPISRRLRPRGKYVSQIFRICYKLAQTW